MSKDTGRWTAGGWMNNREANGKDMYGKDVQTGPLPQGDGKKVSQ
ncbi:MAG: hypothetical protein WCX69_02680 [Candidatus Paceibacterota bacterium]